MKIFYIADTHFGHKNIIRFDNRPFTDVHEMEQTLINNWNNKVDKSDTVYIVGDFCWEKEDGWLRILNKLNGSKVLIRGNHDLKKMSKVLRNKFVDIKDYKEIKDNGRHVILSHYPIMAYKHSYDTNTYMLHGHTHQTTEQKYIDKWTKELRDNISTDVICSKGQIYNVGCMCSYMNYFPRTLDEILENANID